jgi:RimJ/RimL family protein N-acetyltransferase
MEKVSLSKFDEKYIADIFDIGYRDAHAEWSKWDGPYFEEYRSYANVDDFRESDDWKFLLKDKCRCILLNNKPIGMVTRRWIDKKTRWMEVGIIIYDENCWSKAYGYEALRIWISQCFNDFEEIDHLGLTTWSGNIRMMKCSEKLAMKKEAVIRKVRFWQGVYYDSVSYGILRSEWENSSIKN